MTVCLRRQVPQRSDRTADLLAFRNLRSVPTLLPWWEMDCYCYCWEDTAKFAKVICKEVCFELESCKENLFRALQFTSLGKGPE